MDINLTLSPSSSSLFLVVAIYEATSPTVLVSYQSFAAPHTNSRNIVFTGVNPVTHYIIVFANTTNTPGGIIMLPFFYNPSFRNAEIRENLIIESGVTQGIATDGMSFIDTTLAGWLWNIERRGFGTMMKDVEYSFDASSGTVTLLPTNDNPSPAIQSGEIFIIHFQPKITVFTPSVSSSSVNIFNTVEKITTDTALDSTSAGKSFIVAGSNPYLQITLPDITTIAANKPFIFLFEGGNHINASISCFGSNKISWLGQSLSELIGGQSEELWLFKYVDPANTSVYSWMVMNADGNFRNAGEIVTSHTETAINTIYANGALVSRSSYKRLWNKVQNMDSSMMVSEAAWNDPVVNNKGKFTPGDGVSNFRVPQLFNFLRGVNSLERKAGSFEPEAVRVAVDVKGVKVSGTGTTKTMDNINPNGQEFALNQVFDIGTGTETRPSNYGAFFLIRT